MRAAHVIGLGLWAPGFPSPSRWRGGQRDPAATSPAAAALPSRAKRGTSLLTRMAVEVSEQAASQGGCSLSETATVFGSALGEVQTAIDQMTMVESEDGLLSPTRFKNSVHNAAAGLLSIAVENRGFTTALAAGRSTVAMCLLEALALLETEGGTVVVAVADEPVPEPFDAEGRRYEALALGFCLAAEAGPTRSLGLLSGFGRRRLEGAPQLAGPFADNPVAAGLPLLDAILGRESRSVSLEPGREEPYCVDVLAGEAP